MQNSFKYLGTTYETINCGEIVQATVTKYNEELYAVEIEGNSCRPILDEQELEECMRIHGSRVASRRKWDQEEADEKVQAEKEQAIFDASPLGRFLSTKSKMQAGKCKKTLQKLMGYSGKIMPRHEWHEANYSKFLVNDGGAHHLTENYFYDTLTKTELEYMQFLQGGA